VGTTTPTPQERARAVFDLVAQGYDRAALRFFPFAADQLVFSLKPAPGTKVLDVACGTGAATLAAAQAVGKTGRVFAVDVSEGMLKRLEEKAAKFGLSHVDIHAMDGAALDFRHNYFDVTLSSFGIFFMPEMPAALKEWTRVTKPGGKIGFTTFGPSAFQPMADLFLKRIESFGVTFESGDPRTATDRLKDAAACQTLMQSAGLVDVRVIEKQLGYHLKDEREWWEVVWNAGFRGYLEHLAPGERDRFEHEHLQEVAALKSENGLWLDVAVYFATGTKAV
jgi:ubiquinone/menaquinone biosynthesis C-methylase UbiE